MNAIISILLLSQIGMPMGIAFLLATILLFDINIKEHGVRRLFFVGTRLCVLMSVLIAVLFILQKDSFLHYPFDPLITLATHEFEWSLFLDPLAITYLLFASILIFVVCHFSYQYLHKERGYVRFFLLISMLWLGIILISISGNFDVLIMGWELVGIASVFLISFFDHTPRATQNSARALIFYRICDIGLFVASALIHVYFHSNDFVHFKEDHPGIQNRLVAFFVLFATLAKSGQLPMTSWVPRAMEGPTTSSAIFYGALSIHLGPFLMLRCAPLWHQDSFIHACLFTVGISTSIYASLVGKTRYDAKTVLGYASVAQIGLMYVALSFELYTLVMVHMVLHGFLRTWQFLRASSFIHDFFSSAVVREIENKTNPLWVQWLPDTWSKALYHHALQGFHLDGLLSLLIVRPCLFVFGYSRWRKHQS